MARVLIADDSVIMRRNLKVILEMGGHEVVGEAENGMQAIKLYFSIKPDIVTMDISMPVMNGLDALKEIMLKDDDAKVIMVSALSQKKMVLEAIDNGAKHYIIKPIKQDNVLGIIEKIAPHKKHDNILSESENLDGFVFKNEEGIFTIKFFPSFLLEKMQSVENTLRGLFIFKPLIIKIDLSPIDNVDMNRFCELRVICEEIKNKEGRLLFEFGENKTPEFLKEYVVK